MIQSHLQPQKSVHTLVLKMSMNEVATILCSGKLQTLKFTNQQTSVYMQHSHKLEVFSRNTKLA